MSALLPSHPEAGDVNYEDFEKLHVVRRLRQIISNWWKIQIHFTDARGFLRGVPQGKFFNPSNPVCTFVTGQESGFRDCLGLARRTGLEGRTAPHAVLGRCHAGFCTLSMPLRVDGQFLGVLFADGFLMAEELEEQKNQLRSYVQVKFQKDAQAVEAWLDGLPVMSSKDIQHLQQLLEVVIEEVLSLRKTLSDSDHRLEEISRELMSKWDFGKMIGKSHAMIQVFKLLTRVASSDATILITGENGTGKEGIAKAIHYNSSRKNQAFVVQNCGAINDNLLESELFGHLKGAFTGAHRDKKGLFEVAHKGTLFLDEIGDTSAAMQVKLLRVLQEGTFNPVGGTESRKVDVRVVAATNKNLEQMVKEGSFREDLYYRLNVINIKVPPLRERKEDIPLLVDRFLEDLSKESQRPKKRLTRKCLELLERHDWPGNVRELQNEIERLFVLAGDDGEIGHEFLSERIAPKDSQKFPGLRMEGKLKEAIDELEKRMILECLEKTGWNKSRASKILGISRAGLIAKCEKYGFSSGDDLPSAG